MRFLRSCLLLTAIFISSPYVFCWQGNTPESALEEIVTTDKIEVMARHLPVKVEQAIDSLDDKGKKEIAAKLLPKSVMKREGEVFSKSDDGTQWELRNGKDQLEGTIKILNSFISGSDALLSLQFTEYHPAENSKHSDENAPPQRSSEPRLMLVSMRLEDDEWRVMGIGPWQQKNLEDEDFLRGIVPDPQEANAATAAATLHGLNAALAAYAMTHPQEGLPSSLQELGKASTDDVTSEQGSLDPSLAAVPAIRDGYEYRYTLIDPGATDPETKKEHGGRYRITATPVEFGKTGSRSFFTDQSYVIRFTNEDREANENDQPM